MPRRALAALALCCLAACTGGAKPASVPALSAWETACLAGNYDGTATEIAAALELGADGRFRYLLVYGALDERAQGTWQSGEDKVFLTSDPVTPPRFSVLEDEAATEEAWSIALDLPGGLSRQYFDAQFTFADGSVETHQFTEEGLSLTFEDEVAPTRVRLLLPLFDLSGAWHIVTGEGPRTLRFRFEPNDLGKVAFDGKALTITENALLFERHGRNLKLWRQEPPCPQR